MEESPVDIAELLQQKLEFEQSVKYASYIQKALLPGSNELRYFLPQHFLLFLPRDVVSGDFYWIHHEDDITTVAIGDCTGHGVPGAFLSILGISFLNLVYSKHSPESPAVLLNYLREYVMKALNQTGEAYEQKDGIDLSVCMFNNKTGELRYSGSFSPLYIARGGELEQLQGDKMPVGIDAEYEESFTNKSFRLKKEDTVYIYTDGFPDQFGGPKGKKFKYPAFRKLISNCSKLDIAEQRNFLLTELRNWQGKLPQLDDITVMGFKYK